LGVKHPFRSALDHWNAATRYGDDTGGTTNQRRFGSEKEFKFIRWQGGPESIRQNQLFKDFYLLARSDGTKRKYLYVLGTEHPLRFFNGRRAISSVLSRHAKLAELFRSDFGERYAVVRDYYLEHKDKVRIEDVSPYVPSLIADEITESD
jgi:hypothetical protein